jgi:hypothetical protein
MTPEQRAALRERMRGNKNAADNRRVFMYRSSINRSNTLLLLLRMLDHEILLLDLAASRARARFERHKD